MHNHTVGPFHLTEEQASSLAYEYFHVRGTATKLPGELDLNFRIDSEGQSFLLKVSQPEQELAFLHFQNDMMEYVNHKAKYLTAPAVIPNRKGELITQHAFDAGSCHLRLLTWIPGRLWSAVNPQTDKLRYSLGNEAGKLTLSLVGFQHEQAFKGFDWDLAQADWTKTKTQLFSDKQRRIIQYFHSLFDEIQPVYASLRKSVVHNDVNDNNIIVSDDLVAPKVISLIDYGDAINTQTINDLAVAAAYAGMNQPDPLHAILPLITGYHASFSLEERELSVLYTLIGMRLVISVTKSALNKTKDPDNAYLQISEKPAWHLLSQWSQINQNYAHFSFRTACGYPAHPHFNEFLQYVSTQKISKEALFPTLHIQHLKSIDLSIGSIVIGGVADFADYESVAFRLKKLRKEHQGVLFGGGYLEIRPFYTPEAFQKEGNQGKEYRTVHLGTDYWVDAGTPIHAVLEGTVHSIADNGQNGDYGSTLILQHSFGKERQFYSLYGHLSNSTLMLFSKGDKVHAGDLIGYAGDFHENGGWVPHVHVQLMLDMLGNETNFPGVAYPSEVDTWRQLSPDFGLLFDQTFENAAAKSIEDLLSFRKKHLGKSLSLSYQTPLQILRGQGAYLLDHHGRRYLDTVNNVAHVGHEHPAVVQAGQAQMGVLNTNTRYAHPKINEFAEELLSTFPPELSVVHFVNSGSEANELALRMATASTGQKDFIAIEIGYHGNTNATIDVSSYKFDGKGGQGAPSQTHIVPLPDQFRGIHADQPHLYATYIDQKVNKIQGQGKNVAGFIHESIISCGGQIVLPDNYLKSAYQSIRSAGGLCIADEVQVGFGRVGEHFWGFELQGVVPDIVTLGKPIGNGHPIGAVVCTQAVADAFANGMEFFNTYGGNPVSCSIGKEVLQVIKNENLQQHAKEVGNYLRAELKRSSKQFEIIRDVRGHGLFLGIELATIDKKPLPKQTDYLINRMKELGILMSSDGPDHNVLKIKPPMVFSMENAQELITKLSVVLGEDFMRQI